MTEDWWAGPLLTVREVADRLRVSKMTVYRLVEAGDLRAVKVARSIRVPERVLDQYLMDAEVSPS